MEIAGGFAIFMLIIGIGAVIVNTGGVGCLVVVILLFALYTCSEYEKEEKKEKERIERQDAAARRLEEEYKRQHLMKAPSTFPPAEEETEKATKEETEKKTEKATEETEETPHLTPLVK